MWYGPMTMQTGAIVLTVSCGLFVMVLLFLIGKGHPGRGLAKGVASLCFVGLPIVGGVDIWSGYGAWIFIGLIFGALGDVALLGSGRRWLGLGLALFLVGHLAYLRAGWPWTRWSMPAAVVGALLIIVGVSVIAPRAGRLAGPVVAYVGVIAAMVTVALPLPDVWGRLTAAGAVLFALSDLAVARHRFVVASFANKLVGLPMYYVGQLLFAWGAVIRARSG